MYPPLSFHFSHIPFLLFLGAGCGYTRGVRGGMMGYAQLFSRSGSPQDQDLRWENGAHGIHVDGDMPRHRILNRWVAGIIRI